MSIKKNLSLCLVIASSLFNPLFSAGFVSKGHDQVTDGDFEDNMAPISTTEYYYQQQAADYYDQLPSISDAIHELINTNLFESHFNIECYEKNKQYAQEFKSLLIYLNKIPMWQVLCGGAITEAKHLGNFDFENVNQVGLNCDKTICLASPFGTKQNMRSYSLKTGEFTTFPEELYNDALAFHPINPNIAATVNSRHLGHAINSIHTWDIDNTQCIQEIPVSEGIFSALAYSADGNYICTGINNPFTGINELFLFDLNNAGTAIGSCKSNIVVIVCAPDNKTVITGDLNNTVKVWDIPSKSCIAKLNCFEVIRNTPGFQPLTKEETGSQPDAISSIAITSNKKGELENVLIGSRNGCNVLWNFNESMISGEKVAEMLPVNPSRVEPINCEATSPSARYAVTASRWKTTVLYDLVTKNSVFLNLPELSQFYDAAFVSFLDENTLFAVQRDDNILEISLTQGLDTLSIAQLIFLIQAYNHPIFVAEQLEQKNQYYTAIFNKFSDQERFCIATFLDNPLNQTTE